MSGIEVLILCKLLVQYGDNCDDHVDDDDGDDDETVVVMMCIKSITPNRSSVVVISINLNSPPPAQRSK